MNIRVQNQSQQRRETRPAIKHHVWLRLTDNFKSGIYFLIVLHLCGQRFVVIIIIQEEFLHIRQIHYTRWWDLCNSTADSPEV